LTAISLNGNAGKDDPQQDQRNRNVSFYPSREIMVDVEDSDVLDDKRNQCGGERG
jgi:hypothetical protein